MGETINNESYLELSYGVLALKLELTSFKGIETKENELKVYLNPSSGVFKIEFNQKDYLVEIYDVIVNIVYKNTAYSNKQLVDLSNMPR